jgi:hypothetical protein
MLQRSVEMDVPDGKVNLLAVQLAGPQQLHFAVRPARKRHG